MRNLIARVCPKLLLCSVLITATHAAETSGLDAFYQECFVTHYWRVRKVCQKMLFMSADTNAQALQVFVDILTYRPWFYFVDRPKEFRVTHYWEHIMDQCAIMNYFLKTVRVRLKDKTLFIPPLSISPSRSVSYYKNTKTLLEYLRQNHPKVVGGFYALAFDYAIKLFNEGILLKQMRQSTRFFAALESIMGKLRGTEYEADYQETLTNCKQLLQLLKHRTGGDSLDWIDRSMQGSAEEKKMYKEMYELRNNVGLR